MATRGPRDLLEFPLLAHSASQWYKHFEKSSDPQTALLLLRSQTAINCWVDIYNPNLDSFGAFRWSSFYGVGTGVYYASYIGIDVVLKELMKYSPDVNARSGYYGNALCAASDEGHEEIVKILIDHGAER